MLTDEVAPRFSFDLPTFDSRPPVAESVAPRKVRAASAANHDRDFLECCF
jgi:hypothetical protein